MIIAEIPEDDLALARLAGKKLTQLLHGLLTVTVAAAQSGRAADFLRGRDKRILAFVEVLRSTGARPGSVSARELGQTTDQISVLTADFYCSLARLADWQRLDASSMHTAANDLLSVYMQLLDALQGFLQSLEVNVDFIRERSVAQECIRSMFATLSRAPVA